MNNTALIWAYGNTVCITHLFQIIRHLAEIGFGNNSRGKGSCNLSSRLCKLLLTLEIIKANSLKNKRFLIMELDPALTFDAFKLLM